MDFLMLEYPVIIIAFCVGMAYFILTELVLYFQQRSGKIGEIGTDTISARLGIGGGIIALAVSVYYIVTVGDDALKLVLSCVSLVSALAGIVGSVLVKRQRKTAGILMLAAAAGTFITVAGSLLLLFGGIFSKIHIKWHNADKWSILKLAIWLTFPIWLTVAHYLDVSLAMFIAVSGAIVLGYFIMIIFDIKDMIVIKENKEK